MRALWWFIVDHIKHALLALSALPVLVLVAAIALGLTLSPATPTPSASSPNSPTNSSIDSTPAAKILGYVDSLFTPASANSLGSQLVDPALSSCLIGSSFSPRVIPMMVSTANESLGGLSFTISTSIYGAGLGPAALADELSFLGSCRTLSFSAYTNLNTATLVHVYSDKNFSEAIFSVGDLVCVVSTSNTPPSSFGPALTSWMNSSNSISSPSNFSPPTSSPSSSPAPINSPSPSSPPPSSAGSPTTTSTTAPSTTPTTSTATSSIVPAISAGSAVGDLAEVLLKSLTRTLSGSCVNEDAPISDAAFNPAYPGYHPHYATFVLTPGPGFTPPDPSLLTQPPSLLVPSPAPGTITSPPVAPAVPTYKLNITASLPVPDPVGPGCGWAFTGLEPPQVNASRAREKALTPLEDAWVAWPNVAAAYANAYAIYLADLKSYNLYIATTTTSTTTSTTTTSTTTTSTSTTTTSTTTTVPGSTTVPSTTTSINAP